MKNIKLTIGAIALSSIATVANAETKAVPEWTVTGNAGVFSDYRFRGISQTDKEPAFQGGFDVSHKSGFYVGNWNSNVDSALFGGANMEMDFYGGYKSALYGIGYDIGAIHYYYTNSDKYGPKIKNTEVYVGANYGIVNAKISYPVSDFFSAEDFAPSSGNAAGSYYLDVGTAYDLGNGFGLVGHVGYQKAKGAAKSVYFGGESNTVDWKLGATYTMGNGAVFALSYIDTDNDKIVGSMNGNGSSKKISNGTGVLSFTKAF